MTDKQVGELWRLNLEFVGQDRIVKVNDLIRKLVSDRKYHIACVMEDDDNYPDERCKAEALRDFGIEPDSFNGS